jgi:hypothetical protein
VLCVAAHLDDACYRDGGGGRGGGGARSGGGFKRGGHDWIIERSTVSVEGNTFGTSSPTAMAEMRSGVLEFTPTKGSTRHATHAAGVAGRSPVREAHRWGPHDGARVR